MYKLIIFKGNDFQRVEICKTKESILKTLEGALFLQNAINKIETRLDIFIDTVHFNKDGLLVPKLNKKFGVINCPVTNVIFNPNQTELEVENLINTTVEYFKEKLS